MGGRDVAIADAWALLELRRSTVGYVSQFLRVLPRVPAIDVVAEPLIEQGWDPGAAQLRAAEMLERVRLPQALWMGQP